MTIITQIGMQRLTELLIRSGELGEHEKVAGMKIRDGKFLVLELDERRPAKKLEGLKDLLKRN